MKKVKGMFRSIYFGALTLMSSQVLAEVSFDRNQFELVTAPLCNHAPIAIPYSVSSDSFDESQVQVSSDASWAIPAVDVDTNEIAISFDTGALFNSYSATISVDDGVKVVDLFIDLTIPAMNVYRLLDDPLRSKTYGIIQSGTDNGAILAFDPVQKEMVSCLTVGKNPTDFVINDDSTELLVINSVSKNIDVIDLASFALKETIALPSYTSWGEPDDTSANVGLGPDDIIYYSDGAGGPVLHTYKRTTSEVIQSIIFDGSSPTNDTGFMDFAVSNDKTSIIAMPQYGWSAGSHSRVVGQFNINGDGTVTPLKETSLTRFNREPFEAPVLINDDDTISVMKTIAVNPFDSDDVLREFSGPVWSMNPNGTLVATTDKIYNFETGIELYSFQSGNGSGYLNTSAQAFTSDFMRFVYFDESNRSIKVVNLIEELGADQIGRSTTPNHGAVVNSPDSLTWSPVVGIDEYDVYLCSDETSVEYADDSSSCYLGRVTGSSIDLLQALPNGAEYFWRVDPVTPEAGVKGAVLSFVVSDIALDMNNIRAKTVAGHDDYVVEVTLDSLDSGVGWTVSTSSDWISFTQLSGHTPSVIEVHLDASILDVGFHEASIVVSSDAGEITLPVQLEVEALNLTHARSAKDSQYVYAISELDGGAVSKAYLLEIDSTSEKITRVVPVGSNVTDFSLHYADDLIYVTNWKSGNLLAINRTTFEHVKNFAFSPSGSVGSMDGDIYRVAAGASERLVIEEYDQWIDISVYNTKTESVVDSSFVREGGGAFDPTGRYYYHGENNSSGAEIVKFDTAGDAFTQLASVRPSGIPYYYGSRTVVVSEDGSRVFWAGVVFDSDLQTEWVIGDIIYAVSDDGRFAFGENTIYDLDNRSAILTMPESTRASAYNSTSEKLVAQSEGRINFYPLGLSVVIPKPELSISKNADGSISLDWTDQSLENEFIIQYREAGSSNWHYYGETTANTNQLYSVGIEPGKVYEFRVRAGAAFNSSSWSNVVSSKVLPKKTSDFNGDGRSDILWRNTLDGQVKLAVSDEQGNQSYGVNLAVGAPEWMTLQGDFNGDGRIDALRHNQLDGRVRIDLSALDGSVENTVSLANRLSDWQASVADFNGDGRDDILWRELIAGKVRVDISAENGKSDRTEKLYSKSSVWAHQLADFNNDGRADILWRNLSNGDVKVAISDGNGNQASVTNHYNKTSDWNSSLADFNGDGRADILWRKLSTGDVKIALSGSDGGQQSVAKHYAKYAAWTHTLADFNGDGRTDILWRKASTGTVKIAISSATASQERVENLFDKYAAWTHQLGDFNGDGRDDILWRNLANSKVKVAISSEFGSQERIEYLYNKSSVWQADLPTESKMIMPL